MRTKRERERERESERELNIYFSLHIKMQNDSYIRLMSHGHHLQCNTNATDYLKNKYMCN